MLSVISPSYTQYLLGAEWRADEDFLTAEFFGLLRYAPPDVLAAILRRARVFNTQETFEVPTGSDRGRVVIEFWPQYDEGISDGRIRFCGLDLLLEVKLHSGPSDQKRMRPQLVRYADAVRRQSATALLYLTLHAPDDKALRTLEEAAEGTKVLLLRWRDVADAIYTVRSTPLLKDLYHVLSSRGIRASADVPELELGGSSMEDVRRAQNLLRDYYRWVVEAVQSVDAICKGRVQFAEWTPLDFALPKTKCLPQQPLFTPLPMTHALFWWQSDTSERVPRGATWVLLEHCADASLEGVQDQAPGEEGSYLAVFVARPEPGFSEDDFDGLYWRDLLAKQFGCENRPNHLFPEPGSSQNVPRVHRHGGEMHAWRIDTKLLASSGQFAKSVAQRQLHPRVSDN